MTLGKKGGSSRALPQRGILPTSFGRDKRKDRELDQAHSRLAHNQNQTLSLPKKGGEGAREAQQAAGAEESSGA